MHKKFAHLAVVCLLLWSPLALAQEDEEELEVEMFFAEEEVVTSAARHEQEIGMSPSAITVISREDIEASGATNFTDVLRLVPGLEVIIGTPAYSTVATRLIHTDDNNVFLVLMDGREVNVEILGITSFELLPVTIDDIERIEIIRGPGSALYGANALSGVISIITRPIPSGMSFHANLEAGEVGLTSIGARTSTRTGNWGFSLNAGGQTAGMFSDPRVRGRESSLIRSLAEYRWKDGQRLIVDGSYAFGTGGVSAVLSEFGGELSMASLRLALETESLRGQLFWTRSTLDLSFDNDLKFSGISLARLVPIETVGHTIDGEIQWTLPRFFNSLLILVGTNARMSLVSSDQMLDGDTYSDITSTRYHEPGIEHLETRIGAFLHAELAPVDWLTTTGGLRFDYNSATEKFLSPRLTAVFRTGSGQYFRMGVAQSFRKPSYFETGAHLMVEFPDDSPVTGTGRERFQEFMTRVTGYQNLENEELLSFEASYMGRFLNGRLDVSLDLYFNIFKNEAMVISEMVLDDYGLPDLEKSSIRYHNAKDDMHIVGSELAIKYQPSRWITLQASWTHREVTNQASETSPKNLITLGGRFLTECGLVGSLYAFSRSEFWDRRVPNPSGLLEEFQSVHLDTAILVLGRLGWRWRPLDALALEVGLKLFLPFSPSGSPYFRHRELGGGLTASGENYGADLLRRMITAYLKGSF